MLDLPHASTILGNTVRWGRIGAGRATDPAQVIHHSAGEIGQPLRFEGEGVNEVGVSVKTGKTLVKVDPTYFRPTEVELLIGDASKAKRVLGWEPKTKFADLVRIMARADFDGLKCCCSITCNTRSRVCGLTLPSLFKTRETVDFPTPLRRAISLMVRRFCWVMF